MDYKDFTDRDTAFNSFVKYRRAVIDSIEEGKFFDEFFELCATKKYPDARIRRGVLHALLRVTEEDLRAPVSYIRLLAANETGRAFLASARKTSDMPVVTRQTDLPTTREAERQFELESASAALYSKCLPKPVAADEQLRRPPVILETKNKNQKN